MPQSPPSQKTPATKTQSYKSLLWSLLPLGYGLMVNPRGMIRVVGLLVLIVVAVILGFLVIVMPWLIRSKQLGEFRCRFQPCDPSSPDLPRDLLERVQRANEELSALGFVSYGLFSLVKGGSKNSQAYTSLFEHPKAHDTARLNFVTTPMITTASLSFATEYNDGTTYWSSNNALPIITPRDNSHEESLSFPQVEDAKRLYEIHRARMRLTASRSPIGDDPAKYLEAVELRSKQRWLDKGYYCFDATEEAIRPTIKGAYLMTWLCIWPIPMIRRVLRRNRAGRVLLQYGVE